LSMLDDHRADMMRFLTNSFEQSGGDRSHLLNMWELGDELGFSRDEINMIVQHLAVEGLLEIRSNVGRVAITSHGIREVERLIEEKELIDDQEPVTIEENILEPVPIEDVENIVDEPSEDPLPESQPELLLEPEPKPEPVPESKPELKAKPETRPKTKSKVKPKAKPVVPPEPGKELQAEKVEPTDYSDLLHLIVSLKTSLSDIQIDQDDRKELDADLGTIELQLWSSRPKEKIIAQCAHSVGRVLKENENPVTKKLFEKLLKLL